MQSADNAIVTMALDGTITDLHATRPAHAALRPAPVHDERCRAPAITMHQVYVAALPYIVMSLLILVLIFLFPMIATWLPAVLSR
jgi:hypothetical protein